MGATNTRFSDLANSPNLYLGRVCKRGHDHGGGSYRNSKRMCVECQSFLASKHQKENAKKHRESVKKYRDNGGRLLRSEWYQRNKDRLRDVRKEWDKNNPGRRAEYHSKRRALIFMAMPKWANQQEISKFYTDAKRLSEATGVQHEVDHIIPLKNRLVCGLHVPANLQILTASENSRKHNSFADEGTEATLSLDTVKRWASPNKSPESQP